MKASKVHAVVAAALESPALITRWQREPQGLRDAGIEPESLNLDALGKFAGLTAKVKHNGLRADFPLTFRLLNVAGLEIELFSAYASYCATSGKRFAATAAGRVQDLMGFMEHWLDFNRHEHVLLWDLMRHESALTTLGNVNAADAHPPVSRDSKARVKRADATPRVQGTIILREMHSNPQFVGKLLQKKAPPLHEVELNSYHFCYWHKEGGEEIDILELDELGYYLLALIDGATSVATLSRMIGGGSKSSKVILRALGQLAELGIISGVRRPVGALTRDVRLPRAKSADRSAHSKK